MGLNRMTERISWWRSGLGLLVAILLFAAGIWSVPLAIFGPDRALIPGDLGDARFNNYILEHGYRWMTGQERSFWDAPFMFPWQNTVVLSDSHLGTMPFYSTLRGMGFSREGAFQGWLLLMFALNYWMCLLAMRKWAGHWALAACAAFIFAFGIFNIGQINNLQMMPRFMAPLAFLFLWRHLSTGALKYVLLTTLAVVYQFYCGVYLGLMLVYGLFFLAVAHAVAFRGPSFLHRFRQWRYSVAWLVALAGGLLLLAPMMLHYLELPKDVGDRTFASILPSLPRPSSYFFTHPAAMSWRSLSYHGVDAIPEWWRHFHFIGILPWLAVLAAPFVLLSKRVAARHRRMVAAAGAGLVLSILFTLHAGDFTLYRLFFALPGFSAVRAVDGFINVEVLFFLVLFVLVLRPLFRGKWTAVVLSLVLPVAVVQDNRWDVGWLKSFDKHDSSARVQDVGRRILREYGGPERWDAIAYEPPIGWKTSGEESHFRLITLHIDAMLAAQELGIPVVNAYTSGYPGNYLSFFDHMDHRALAEWCAYNGVATDRIQEIHGLAVPVARMDTVAIRASNGKYLCVEPDEDTVKADRNKPLEWETFIRLRMEDGRVAFLAHTDRFLFADLEGEGYLRANGLDLGDFGLFMPGPRPDGAMVLRTFDGRYLALDPATTRLQAVADTAGRSAAFTVGPAY